MNLESWVIDILESIKEAGYNGEIIERSNNERD